MLGVFARMIGMVGVIARERGGSTFHKKRDEGPII